MRVSFVWLRQRVGLRARAGSDSQRAPIGRSSKATTAITWVRLPCRWAVLSYEIENLSGGEPDLTMCDTIPDYIGDENGCSSVPHEKGSFFEVRGNRNELRYGGGLMGVFMHVPELPTDCRHKGDIFILSEGRITRHTAWKDVGWGGTNGGTTLYPVNNYFSFVALPREGHPDQYGDPKHLVETAARRRWLSGH